MSFLADLEEDYNVEYSPEQHAIISQIEEDFFKTNNPIFMSSKRSHIFYDDIQEVGLGCDISNSDFTFELLLHEMMHFIFANNKQRTSIDWGYHPNKEKNKNFLQTILKLESKVMAYVWTLLEHYNVDEFDSLNEYLHNMTNGLMHSLKSYGNFNEDDIYETIYAYIEDECHKPIEFKQIQKEWFMAIEDFKGYLNETKRASPFI